MLDVFRFAWFGVRTFFGICGLILALYMAMWAFVRLHSAMAGNADPDAALKRVMSYNAPKIGREDGKVAARSPTARSDCGAARAATCLGAIDGQASSDK
jgi:hypothetical protein